MIKVMFQPYRDSYQSKEDIHKHTVRKCTVGKEGRSITGTPNYN